MYVQDFLLHIGHSPIKSTLAFKIDTTPMPAVDDMQFKNTDQTG